MTSAPVGIPEQVLRGHERLISSMSLLDSFLFSADELGLIKVWKRLAHDEFVLESSLRIESQSISSISAVKSAHDEVFVFVQVKSGFIRVFNYSDGAFEKMEDLKCGTFTFCKMSAVLFQGQIFIAYPSVNAENSVEVLNFDTKVPVMSSFLPISSKGSGMCLFSKLFPCFQKKDTLVLICGYESGVLVVLDVSDSLNISAIIEAKIMEEGCTDADFDVAAGTVVVVGVGKAVHLLRSIWDSSQCTHSKLELPFPGCGSISIRPDGKLFVTGGWDAKVRFYSLKSLKPLAILEHHYETVTAVISHPNYTLAASADGTISRWKLYTD